MYSAGTSVIDKRPIQGEVAVRLDASCYRNRNKPNSVTVHVGLMPRARLERSDFLDRTPIKERPGWRWAVYFYGTKTFFSPKIPYSIIVV